MGCLCTLRAGFTLKIYDECGIMYTSYFFSAKLLCFYGKHMRSVLVIATNNSLPCKNYARMHNSV